MHPAWLADIRTLPPCRQVRGAEDDMDEDEVNMLLDQQE